MIDARSIIDSLPVGNTRTVEWTLTRGDRVLNRARLRPAIDRGDRSIDRLQRHAWTMPCMVAAGVRAACNELETKSFWRKTIFSMRRLPSVANTSSAVTTSSELLPCRVNNGLLSQPIFFKIGTVHSVIFPMQQVVRNLILERQIDHRSRRVCRDPETGKWEFRLQIIIVIVSLYMFCQLYEVYATNRPIFRFANDACI
jgi:hypothetical protein